MDTQTIISWKRARSKYHELQLAFVVSGSSSIRFEYMAECCYSGEMNVAGVVAQLRPLEALEMEGAWAPH
jgi:hypothetical protein